MKNSRVTDVIDMVTVDMRRRICQEFDNRLDVRRASMEGGVGNGTVILNIYKLKLNVTRQLVP